MWEQQGSCMSMGVRVNQSNGKRAITGVELAMWWKAPITCITVIFLLKYQFTFLENEADIHLLMLEKKKGGPVANASRVWLIQQAIQDMRIEDISYIYLTPPVMFTVNRTHLMLHCSIYVQNTRSDVPDTLCNNHIWLLFIMLIMPWSHRSWTL